MMDLFKYVIVNMEVLIVSRYTTMIEMLIVMKILAKKNASKNKKQ